MNRGVRATCAGFASALALSAATASLAQSTGASPTPDGGGPQTPAPSASAEGGTALQEVVVTAQRRSQNLQNVPIAVTSFSATALAVEHVVSTVDLGRVVPNMFSANNVGQGSANVYYIRGLGQTQSFPTFEPQVGTYVDDIYISRQNANNFALFGVDQLQVLRGPQGTLFGRNSTGGAVLVTLQKPAANFGGSLQLGVGSYDSFTGRASIDLPLSDQVRTRTAAYGINDSGFVDDLTTHQVLNATHNFGVREAVTLLPHAFSNVEWDLAADYERNDSANVLNFPGPGGVNGYNRVSYSGLSLEPGALKPYLAGSKGGYGQGAVVKSFGGESNLRLSFDAGTVNFITGFRGLHQALDVDFPDGDLGPLVPYDQSPIGSFALAQDLTGYQYSQELKWTGELGHRLNYTAGVFYLFETNRDSFGAVANLASIIGPLIGVPGLASFPAVLGDEYSKNQTISEAGYAQGDLKLTDQLSVTVGGRFTHEIKSVLVSPAAAAKNGFTTADVLAAGYKTHLDADEFTPRFAIQYQVDPQLMAFASATRGFQGGGWNGLAFSAQTFNNFGPETIWSYEAGERYETRDHRLRFNSTLFYQNVSDYQLLSDLTQAASFVTTNAANLEAFGAEFDVTWLPIEHLTLTGNLGLIKALYFGQNKTIRAQQAACKASPGLANLNCGVGIVNEYGRLANPTFTPPVTASTSATYDFDVYDTSFSPSVSAQYTAKETVGTAGVPSAIDKARFMLDLALVIKPHNTPLSFTLECKNCTMTDYDTQYLFNFPYFNRPGTWDVSASYKF